MSLLKRFKFWLYDVFKKNYVKMWIFKDNQVLGINNEEITRLDKVKLLDRFYEIDLSKSLKFKNHFNLYYHLENSQPIRFSNPTVKYTNKDLSSLINHKLVTNLFNVSNIENIILMILSGGGLIGILYLIFATGVGG